jgi:hypothetical protein
MFRSFFLFFFFSTFFQLVNAELYDKRAKIFTAISALGLSELHTYISSIRKKSAASVEKEEISMSESIYGDVFKDKPMVDLIIAFYREILFSYYFGKSADSFFFTLNKDLFVNSLISSFYSRELIKEFIKKRNFASHNKKLFICGMFLGVFKGIAYYAIENQIEYFLSKLAFLKEREVVKFFIKAIMSTFLIKGFCDKCFTGGVNYVFKKDDCLQKATSFVDKKKLILQEEVCEIELREDAVSNALINSDFCPTRKEYFLDMVDFGLLSTRTFISLVELIESFKK